MTVLPISLFQVRQGPKPQVLSDNNPGPGQQPQHLVYLEKLRKLRAQGGLESDSKNVDQENVENYSNTGPASATSYSSGFGEREIVHSYQDFISFLLFLSQDLDTIRSGVNPV